MRHQLVLALLLAILSASPAHAHKLKTFAFAEGATIRGTAYFAGGSPARDVRVAVFDPDGRLLAETRTDAEGRFAVAAVRRVDHRLVADSGDGHLAEFVIAAAELPLTLPAGDGVPVQPTSPPVAAASTGTGTVTGGGAEIAAMVDEAVARQLGPLRAQLDGFEDQVRLRDILGGIGYIVGLTGLVLWLRSGRR